VLRRRRTVSKQTEEDDDEWIRPIGGLLEENKMDVRCMTRGPIYHSRVKNMVAVAMLS
jgi:hypothetical protein